MELYSQMCLKYGHTGYEVLLSKHGVRHLHIKTQTSLKISFLVNLEKYLL